MDPIWQKASIIAHTTCLIRSLKRWTGREWYPDLTDPVDRARTLFEAPFVVVSHGMESDPILNYGNRTALELWEMNWEELIQTPSRLTAEAPNRAERARLLEVVTRQGFIDDYAGVRISRSGRRFQIARATVWNLLDESGIYCGQAATFDRWEFL